MTRSQCGKTRYRTRRRARKALEWLQWHKEYDEAYLYRCSKCGAIHITTLPLEIFLVQSGAFLAIAS